MLCRGCGHVMVWTEDLNLRELTAKERIDAGTNSELMRERAKIVPDRAIRHHGTSLVMTSFIVLIVVMAGLEQAGILKPIHPPTAPINVVPPVQHPWTKIHP